MSLPIIDKEHQGWHLALFGVGSVVGFGFLVVHHITKPASINDNGWLGVATAVLTDMGSVVIVVAASTVTAIEGVAMISERYKKVKYEEGKQDGKREGRREGLEEGRREILDMLTKEERDALKRRVTDADDAPSAD